ncbi:helix-turn-helix transcriptional regulator [Streptococcus salivarius]
MGLREIILQKGITEVELANKIGVSVKTIARWEKNVMEMTLKDAVKVVEILNINLDTLVFDDYRLVQNRKELRRVEDSFFRNNKLPHNSSEKYIKSFRRNLGNFIAGNKALQNSPNIKKFLLKTLEKDFVYYSKETIEEYLKKVYSELCKEFDKNGDSINNCYVSSILNTDVSTYNSSKNLMSIFGDTNELDNNKFFTLEPYFNHEVNYEEAKKELESKINDNPDHKYYPKELEKLKLNYESDKASYIKDLGGELKSKNYLIFIDDFSGSGATIKRFFQRLECYIPLKMKIIIVCVHMMEKAETKLRSYFENSVYKERVNFYTDSLKTSSRKKYFNSKKDPLKIEIRDFETSNFEQQFALGFEATEALVATYKNCPNNTFASFWYQDNPLWTPLFNRPRKRSSTLDKINFNKNNWLKNVKFGLKRKGVPSEDYPRIIALILVKTGKDSTTTKVDIDFKYKFQYNECILQECITANLITIKSDVQDVSRYLLTQEGKELLKSYHLLTSTFETLTETKETDASDKLKMNDNDYEISLLNDKSAE